MPPSSTTQYEPESFEEWFKKLGLNQGLMSLLFSIYQYDQLGKANNIPIDIKLLFKRGQIKQVLDNSVLDQLSNCLEAGVLDNAIKLYRD